MINTVLIRTKFFIKRLLGYCVYAYIYIKNTLQNKKTGKKSKKEKKILNFIATAAERWRLLCCWFLSILVIYYGLGALISSRINNDTSSAISCPPSGNGCIINALSHVLKVQIDKEAWTPALPKIFPAAALDNLPNFQLGAQKSAAALIKKIAQKSQHKALKEAAELLAYPPDIWLFSKTSDDTFAPGSARQYRKALTKIKEFANNDVPYPANKSLYLLFELEHQLKNQIEKLHKQVLEHSTDTLDLKADDIFYHAQGTAYTLYYALAALGQDLQQQILKAGQYENLTTALKFLKDAETLEPFVVKNAPLNEAYEANHLIYLAYFLAKAQKLIAEIAYNLQTIESTSANDY